MTNKEDFERKKKKGRIGHSHLDLSSGNLPSPLNCPGPLKQTYMLHRQPCTCTIGNFGWIEVTLGMSNQKTSTYLSIEWFGLVTFCYYGSHTLPIKSLNSFEPFICWPFYAIHDGLDMLENEVSDI